MNFKTLKEKAKTFVNNIHEDKISIYAGQSSFFIILSIFPFLLLLLNLLTFIPNGKEYLLTIINTFSSAPIKELLNNVINQLFQFTSGLTISISVILAIWSAAKGIHSVMNGLSNINNLHRNRTFLITRLISMAYTLGFVLVIFISLILLIFGNKIIDFFISYVPSISKYNGFSMIIRYIIMFIIFIVFFTAIYRLANIKHTTILKVLPGAFITSIGWIGFSLLYSIYVDKFNTSFYLYGSLTSFIILMLWVYCCIYIFFIGHEVNKVLFPSIIASDKEANKPYGIKKYKEKRM